jgi:hypothetical protein
MKLYFAALALMLAGCATDQYAVIPNSAGRGDLMQTDLRACKHQAIHEHFDGRSHVGVLVGGVLGGAVGGALGGVIDAADDNDRLGINDLTERCMRARGYEGTSRG